MSVVYTRNQPQATDYLEISQPNLYKNTNAADTFFGNDHVAFSAPTNQGRHTVINSIPQESAPTSTTNPLIYAFQQYSAIGPIHYSEGVSGAVPSPITTLQSLSTPLTLANGASLTILNCKGMTLFVANGYTIDATSPRASQATSAYIVFAGGIFTIVTSGPGGLQWTSSGTDLQVKNNGTTTSNFYWTLQPLRIQ